MILCLGVVFVEIGNTSELQWEKFKLLNWVACAEDTEPKELTHLVSCKSRSCRCTFPKPKESWTKVGMMLTQGNYERYRFQDRTVPQPQTCHYRVFESKVDDSIATYFITVISAREPREHPNREDLDRHGTQGWI